MNGDLRDSYWCCMCQKYVGVRNVIMIDSSEASVDLCSWQCARDYAELQLRGELLRNDLEDPPSNNII